MTATVPEMTVEKLTDDAIAKRIRAIDRLVAARKSNIDDLQAEIIGFQRERAVLIQAQIDRLQAQLPGGKEAANG